MPISVYWIRRYNRRTRTPQNASRIAVLQSGGTTCGRDGFPCIRPGTGLLALLFILKTRVAFLRSSLYEGEPAALALQHSSTMFRAFTITQCRLHRRVFPMCVLQSSVSVDFRDMATSHSLSLGFLFPGGRRSGSDEPPRN